MLNLVPLEESHYNMICSWGAYEGEFTELDYALRKGGWLDEYLHKANSLVFAALYNDEVVGFSILSDDEYGTEFRIAIKNDKIGQGFGYQTTTATLKKAFAELEKKSVYLIVRLNNIKAQKLYKKIGFIEQEQVLKTINQKEIKFIKMRLKVETE